LLGGGHSHVQLIRYFSMRPLKNTQIIVISRDIHTPYSGMLPGLIAGHYDFDDCHIDLAKLTRGGNIAFVAAASSGIDLEAQVVKFADRPSIYYDTLSINLGAVPNQATEGVKSYALSVKPIDIFLRQLDEKLALLESQPTQPIAIVGGGAAGIEVAMALRTRLDSMDASNEILLIARNGLLTEKSERFQQQARQQLTQRCIEIIEDEVTEVKPESILLKQVGEKSVLFTVWAAGAMARPWLQQTGLECTEDGFIAVKDTLQSVSHGNVFAAGDVATVVDHPRPKAGVFAVRQGKPLIENIKRQIAGTALKPFRPQQSFLTLLACGEKYAIGCKGKLYVSGKWVWRWKDYIDQKFMRQFTVTAKQGVEHSRLNKKLAGKNDSEGMRCTGCGGKISGNVLTNALNLQLDTNDSIENTQLTSSNELKGIILADAAVVDIAGHKLIQSVDFFTDCIFDDFYLGQLVGIHAVNDLLASGIVPQSALSTIGLPQASDAIQSNRITQIMAGINQQLQQWGIAVSGGHTAETDQTQVGLSVSGLVPAQLEEKESRQMLWQKSGANAGEVIVLTQAIGSGVLLAGYQGLQSQGRWVVQWLEQVLASRSPIFNALKQLEITAATDVSGFGLLGHLAEICQASNCGARIESSKVPVFVGAKQLAKTGVASSLLTSNIGYATAEYFGGTAEQQRYWSCLLSDPQTAGGLVLTLSKSQAEQLMATYHQAVIIGEITSDKALLVDIDS
jgi:selenide,water dikinase